MIELLPKKAVKELKKSLSEKRYLHSIGVMKTAFRLADSWKDHPVDRTLLAWASLFHDCGKEIPKKERDRLCSNGGLLYGKELLEIGKLNHAPLGALLLQDRYGVQNRDVLMAVAYHPTGHRDLTPIGWMVYIADFLEPGRKYMPKRLEYLKLARKDPLDGLKKVTELRVNAILQKDKPAHPLTEQFLEYLDGLSTL